MTLSDRPTKALLRTGLFAVLGGLLRRPGSGASALTSAAANGGERPFASELCSVAVLAVLALLCALALAAAPALATGDANMSSCPAETQASPGFRSWLPDCRADELVAPPYAGGEPLEPAPIFATAGGERVIGLTLGGFAETGDIEETGGTVGAAYEFTRSSAGWIAEALDPPATEFPKGAFTFASRNLTRTLWQLAVPKEAGEELHTLENWEGYTLAVREAAGDGKGQFTLLGPVVSPEHELFNPAVPGKYHVVGASGDLGHVVLWVQAGHKQQWPGDDTVSGDHSLYEYDEGHLHEPMLVGVRNDGPPPWKASASYLNEGAELISECGTAFDGISVSGGQTVFTAEPCSENAGEPAVSEIYARIDGAETIKLSGSEAAEYKGMSENGEKVFFMEGGSLREYDFASGGGEGVVAPEVSGVDAVSGDGTRVYFESTAVLGAAENVPGKDVNGNGEPAVLGQANVYAYDTVLGEAKTRFVGADLEAMQTTPSGAFAVFASSRPLKGTNDTAGSQLFEYESETEKVARISVGQKSPTKSYLCEATGIYEEGYNCDGNTKFGYAAPQFPERSPNESEHQNPADVNQDLAVAENGAVVFGSPLALVPGAPAGEPFVSLQGSVERGSENMYEYRAGHIYLISRADEAPLTHESVRLRGIDESGKDVLFATPYSLLPQATGSQWTLYDAREDGGFPAPESANGCQGESCQGALQAPPALAAPASNTLTGRGNLASPPTAAGPATVVKPKPKKCKTHFVKKKGKCVKTRHKAARTKRGDK